MQVSSLRLLFLLLVLLPLATFAQKDHTLLFTSHLTLGGGVIGARSRIDNGFGGTSISTRSTNAGFGADGNIGVHYVLKDRFAPGLKFNFGGVVLSGNRSDVTRSTTTLISILFGSNFLFPVKDKLSAHAGAYLGPGFALNSGLSSNGQAGFTMELGGGLSYEVIDDLHIDGGLKYQFFVFNKTYDYNAGFFTGKTTVTLDYHLIGIYLGARYFLHI
jgi:hypothetical protein